jgi:hypothetical protein
MIRPLFVSSLLAAPLMAQQFPEVEPNDVASAAQVVALGSQVNCTLAAGEQDWFEFTTATGGYYLLSLAGGATSSLDTQMELYDATGTNVLAFNDDGQSLLSSLFLKLSSGTYKLKVVGFSASTAGAYTLDVSDTSWKPPTGIELEPNDTVATANLVADGAQLGCEMNLPVSVLADTAGAANTTTLIQSSTALTAGQYADGRHWLRFTSGANANEERRITANTAGDLTVDVVFPAAAAAGDAFEVLACDADVFRFDVTAPRALVGISVTEGSGSWVSGYSWEVLDSAGALVNSALYGTNAGDSGTFNARLTSYRVLPTGTWHARILRRKVALTGAPASGPANGNYHFELKVRDMNVGGVVAEAAEPNSTVATATPIAAGQQGQGNLTLSTGADASDLWGPITVSQQTLVCFQTDAGAAPAMSDTTVVLRQLLDPVAGTLSAGSSATSGNVLAGAGTSHARGTFNLLLPGTVYFLEVRSPGTTAATQAGNYVLEISLLDTPPYAAGNWATASANGTGCGTPGVPTISRVMGTSSTASFGELPIVGQTLVTRTTNLNGAGNLGLMLLGITGAQGINGALPGTPESVYSPLGLDLGFLGAPGCTSNVDPIVVQVLAGDASGTVDHVLPIPGNLFLAGFVMFMQPCKWDFATPVNALGIQPGNWARVIVGSRTF